MEITAVAHRDSRGDQLNMNANNPRFKQDYGYKWKTKSTSGYQFVTHFHTKAQPYFSAHLWPTPLPTALYRWTYTVHGGGWRGTETQTSRQTDWRPELVIVSSGPLSTLWSTWTPGVKWPPPELVCHHSEWSHPAPSRSLAEASPLPGFLLSRICPDTNAAPMLSPIRSGQWKPMPFSWWLMQNCSNLKQASLAPRFPVSMAHAATSFPRCPPLSSLSLPKPVSVCPLFKLNILGPWRAAILTAH